MVAPVDKSESPAKAAERAMTPKMTPRGTPKVTFQITTPKGQEQQDDSSTSASTSSDSSPDTDAGARLTDNDFDDSPIVARRKEAEANGDGPTKSPVRGVPGGVRFQLGSTPGGDLFLSPTKQRLSPNKLRRATMNHERLEQQPPLLPRSLRYRSSDITARQRLGEIDAQGLYPQSSCVFVANLPEGKEDRALEAALTREFSQYGTVFVKIRRDSHNMPFAFCQYTNDTDAKTAMEKGKGTQILGRACRTEMVKANRSFVIQKKDGTSISIPQVQELMETYGALDKCEPLNSASYGGPAVLVQFRMYDPDRDLTNVFRVSKEYRAYAFDPSGRTFGRPKNPDENFMSRYEVDRRSVFVGNLYEDVTREDLATLFDDIGDVNDIQVMKKSLGAAGHRVYAFVEFAQIDMPETAIKRFHETTFQGCKLRIERKIGRPLAGGPRRVQSQVLPKHRSPVTPIDTTMPAAPRPALAQTTPSPVYPQNFMPFGGGHPYGSPMAYYGPSPRIPGPPSPWFPPSPWGYMQDGMGMYYPCPSPTTATTPTTPGYVLPGHAIPGHAIPGHALHGHAVPGHAVHGHAVPGHAVPGPNGGAGQNAENNGVAGENHPANGH